MFYGTELMVRKLLADRLFLDPDKYNNFKAPPAIDSKTNAYFRTKYNELWLKRPLWLDACNMHLRITLEEQTESPTAVGVPIKTDSPKYYVTMNLDGVPHRDFESDVIYLQVHLVDLGGHQTLWTMEEAAGWMQIAALQVPFRISLTIQRGDKMSPLWRLKRKQRLDENFDKISIANLTAKAVELGSKIATRTSKKQMAKINLLVEWQYNITQVALFADMVRAGNFNG